jgi:hypothetical protein
MSHVHVAGWQPGRGKRYACPWPSQHATLRRRPRDEYMLRGSTPQQARRRAGGTQLGRLEGGARTRARVAEEGGLVLLAQRGEELRG